MARIQLDPPQVDLLRSLVEKQRSIPNDKRDAFFVLDADQGTFVYYPQVSDGWRLSINLADLEVLASYGLIQVQYGQRGVISNFIVHPAGMRAFDESMQREAGVGRDEDLLDKAEQLKMILVSRATGGAGDEDLYKDLRREFMEEHPEVVRRLPTVVRTHRDLTDFWTFIKNLSPSYDGRRLFLREAFEPLLAYLEGTEEAPERDATPDERAQLTRQPDYQPSADQPPQRPAPSPVAKTQPSSSDRVFVVHGHNKGPREAVARLLSTIGLTPVILEEQPNSGRTIIEKLEENTDVAAAVVVLTPEDEARRFGSADPYTLRARQNVIAELGFFIGLLGRKHVVAIVVDKVERPSDVDGVLYVSFDEAGAWRVQLARELRAAGLPVDMGKL